MIDEHAIGSIAGLLIIIPAIIYKFGRIRKRDVFEDKLREIILRKLQG